jgi:hypothetical protein
MKTTSPRPNIETGRRAERRGRAASRVAVAGDIDLGNWRMPSGLGLAEFALRGGFVAPGLMRRAAPGEGGRS